jgi:hypothetical protein
MVPDACPVFGAASRFLGPFRRIQVLAGNLLLLLKEKIVIVVVLSFIV